MPVNDFLIAGSEHYEIRKFKSISLKADDLFLKLDMISIDKIGERELLEHVKEEYQHINDLAIRIFSISDPVGNMEGGRLMEDMDRLVDDASADLHEFHDNAIEESKEVLIGWQSATSRLNRILFFGVSLSVLIIMVSLMYFRRTISFPINAIKDTAHEFAQGNMDHKIKVTTNDEISYLAHSFNSLGAELQKSYAKLNNEIAERKKLQEELQVLSVTDELTGLYNRRGFCTLVEHLLKVAV